MPNPPEPDEDSGEEVTESYPLVTDAATDVIAKPDPPEAPERRFTAPGFDANETTIIHTQAPEGPRTAPPQSIPPRLAAKLRPGGQRNWGWVAALILIVLALAAIAVLGTVLLARNKTPGASQEDQVRRAIQEFDIAVQNGDLPALRSMTCGATRDGYLNYDDRDWGDTYRRVSAAKQYPVVASIDQVIVNGERAEANVTTFMAYAPQVRSTRSFDLQFRDDRWKICQSSGD